MNHSYDWTNTVNRLCEYILGQQKTRGHIGGINVRPETAALEIQAVQHVWRKQNGRQMRHYILSFADSEAIGTYEALEIAYQVAAYYASDYQIVFGIHIPQNLGEHLHIHFGMNAVSFRNGKKYSGGQADYHRFRKHIDMILRKYDCRLDNNDLLK